MGKQQSFIIVIGLILIISGIIVMASNSDLNLPNPVKEVYKTTCRVTLSNRVFFDTSIQDSICSQVKTRFCTDSQPFSFFTDTGRLTINTDNEESTVSWKVGEGALGTVDISVCHENPTNSGLMTLKDEKGNVISQKTYTN